MKGTIDVEIQAEVSYQICDGEVHITAVDYELPDWIKTECEKDAAGEE